MTERIKVRYGRNFVAFDIVSNEPVPLPPYAFESYPSTFPKNIPITEQPKNGELAPEKTEKPEPVDKQ